MNVEIVEGDKRFAKVKFDGDAHTVLNLIKKRLLNDAGVSFAGYKKPHTLVCDSFLVVKTKRSKPEKKIKDAVSDIVNDLESLKLK